jgi:Domain of unknown function (DUF4124)
MNIRHILSGAAVLAITVCANVAADDIYMWTDADGNVHYEDRPSGQPSEVRLQFSYNRTDQAAVQQRVKTQRDAVATRQAAKTEAQEQQQAAAESRAAAEERQIRCQTYRATLATMLESRRVYREDASGERTYLDETARAEARSKAEKLIKDTCDD